MGHDHKHSHPANHHHGMHRHDHSSEKNLAFVTILNFVFAVIELIGGVMTNSVAILSDALHDFGDSLSLGISYYLQRLSKKKRDASYTYGYRRFSLLGGLFMSAVLALGSIYVCTEAIARLYAPEPANAQGMLYFAIFGILVNGLAALRLRGSHGHNEKAVFLHFLEDILGWVAVGISGIVMMFIEVTWLDPALSLAIAFWVMWNVFRNLKSVLQIFLQQSPAEFDRANFNNQLIEIPGVQSYHDLHLWSLDGENHIMTLHLVLENNLEFGVHSGIKRNVRSIAEKFGIHHVTIELEAQNEDCVSCD
ncbi:MAG: cation transporter [Leptospiraceae bacterium]|nr:cation transporter [Leptospiraceae bacterium]